MDWDGYSATVSRKVSIGLSDRPPAHCQGPVHMSALGTAICMISVHGLWLVNTLNGGLHGDTNYKNNRVGGGNVAKYYHNTFLNSKITKSKPTILFLHTETLFPDNSNSAHCLLSLQIIWHMSDDTWHISQSFGELTRCSHNMLCGQCDVSNRLAYRHILKSIVKKLEEKNQKFSFHGTWINFNQICSSHAICHTTHHPWYYLKLPLKASHSP